MVQGRITSLVDSTLKSHKQATNTDTHETMQIRDTTDTADIHLFMHKPSHNREENVL